MSKSIDERVVEMRFDNKNFESGVKNTLDSLNNLKKGLDFENSGKGLKNLTKDIQNFSFQKMAEGIDALNHKFSTLGIVGITAIQNIANSAINAGKRIASALTIDPIKTGFQEYETQINATQTILANTSSKGTTIDDVNKALEELNLYADKTIYNFTEMTRNIGTFTAAGVDLDVSVSAIKGIANLAAVSGSTSQQASTAMYQLSQALSSGTVKLMDWNSVVNAGMGGQIFQDALKETARLHGIAIDQMIEDEGSFRETLSNGWLSSMILTETLAKFTGDMSRDTLIEVGYTEEQVEEILKLGQTANDAATKVKTFSQLWETLKEAAQSGWSQSWKIIVGDFEEAKELLTTVSDTLGGMLDASSNARNEMLQGWKDLGGRQKLIEAFKNAFDGIMSIIKPIKEAFREVFPPITSERLLAITEQFVKLTEKFKIGEDTAAKLKSIFRGLFSAISLVGQIIKTVVGAFTSLVNVAFPAGDGLLSMAAAFGDYLTGIKNAAKESEFFANILDNVKQRIEKIPSIFENMINGVKKLAPIFFKFGSGVSKVFEAIGKFISARVANFSFDKMFEIFQGGAFIAILMGIKKFIDSLTDFVSSGGGILDGIKGILDGVRGSLEAYQNNLKAGSLMKIAIAVGILAASLFVLSTIDAENMAVALTGITIIFAELVGALAIFNKISSGMKLKSTGTLVIALIGISAAVLILSAAVKNLDGISWEGITKGLVGVAALMGMLIGSAKLLSMGEGTVIKGAFSLLIFAGALSLLTNAVVKLAALQPHELANGLIGVGAILLEIGIFMKAMDSSGLGVKTSVGILVLAVGLNLLATAVKQFGNMNIETMLQGLIGLGVVLLEIEIFTSLMGGTTGMIATATGLTIMAGAMLIFSGAIRSFGSIPFESLLVGLIGLGATLLIIGLAMEGMKLALPGAFALLVVAAAISVLSLSLKLLASISVKQIVKGLLTLVGVFVIIGVAGLLLAPLVPILLGLGAAILMLGIGTVAIGAGLLLVSAGLSAFAIAITAAAAAVVLAIATILGLIPMTLNIITDTLVAIARIIGEGGVAIINAFVDIILAIANAIIVLTPVVIEAIDVLLTGISNFIVDFVPRMVVAGMELILGVLKGIRDHIKEVTITAIEIVIAFIEGVAEKSPDVIQAGFELVIAFINGLAEALRGNTQPLVEAIGNLMSAIIEAGLYILTEGVPDFLSKGTDLILKGLIPGVGGQITAFVTKIKELPSKALTGLGEFFGGFVTAGKNLVDGFVKGIKDGKDNVGTAASDLGGRALYETKKRLQMESPSKAFFDIGRNADLGFANGLTKFGTVVNKAAGGVGQNAIDNISKSIAGVSDIISGDVNSSPTIRPVLDMTEVQNGIKSLSNSQYGLSIAGSMTRANSISNLESSRREVDIKSSTPERGDTYYNVEVNNPKPAAAPESVRNVLLKHSYGVL